MAYDRIVRETSTRLLQLLTLLQGAPARSAAELARRLGVTPRTVRRDIERLRDLDYPVDSSRGVPGYRLRGGASMPPLLFDDDEATAVAVALRTAAAIGGVAGLDDSTVAALVKLQQVLPDRLRRRVAAIGTAVEAAPAGGPVVDADTLATVALACRDHRQLDVDYVDHEEQRTHRRIEPHRVVRTSLRWYLVAWDTRRDDWRTLRLDRLSLPHPPGALFRPRHLADGEAREMVTRGVGGVLWPYRETVRVTVAIDAVAPRRPLPAGWTLEAAADGTCLLHAGAENPARLALYLVDAGVPFRVAAGTPLAAAVAALAQRAGDAVGADAG